MKLRKLETLENQRVVIYTCLRGKYLKARQLVTVVENCRVERLENNWNNLTFRDLISGKTVTIRRKNSAIQILNADDNAVAIRGFEGFTDRPKRPAKRAKIPDPLTVPWEQAITTIIADGRKDNSATTIGFPLAYTNNDQRWTISASDVQMLGHSKLLATSYVPHQDLVMHYATATDTI